MYIPSANHLLDVNSEEIKHFVAIIRPVIMAKLYSSFNYLNLCKVVKSFHLNSK